MASRKSRQNTSDHSEMAKYTMSVTVMITGVAAHKIRRFERFGLCNPARTTSRQRLFSDEDITLIRNIYALEQKGINMVGIKTILCMRKDGNGE